MGGSIEALHIGNKGGGSGGGYYVVNEDTETRSLYVFGGS